MPPPPPSKRVFIRPFQSSDSPSLSKICLLTGDAGISAAPKHSTNPGADFLGNVYAVPYAHMTNTWGFVLVSSNESGEEDVVGYTLGATDTRAFEVETEEKWYPPLRERFPLSLVEDDATTTQPNSSTIDFNPAELTPEDKRFIKLFHKPDTAYDACISFSPAHLHIDILPEYQRQGWGRKLIDTAIRHLNAVGRSASGGKLESIWLGMDPRNKEAAKFYERLGFKRVPGAPETCAGVRFEDWLQTSSGA